MKAKKKQILIPVLIGLLLIAAAAGAWLGFAHYVNQKEYDTALSVLAQGNRDQALILFENLGGFRDSREQAAKLRKTRQEELDREAEERLADAAACAAAYDYDGALALLDGFSGDPAAYPEFATARASYETARSQLVPWEDPEQILRLTVSRLIAEEEERSEGVDPENYLTCSEFLAVLEALYAEGYMLIRPEDQDSLYLPQGKKPLLLLQTEVSYPPSEGQGFAKRLFLDEQGKLTCQYVNAEGETLTGDYDLVPILNGFVADHPDFSYKNARAILAVSGCNGLFGYRTTPETETLYGTAYYENECNGAAQIARSLHAEGYTIACATYGNIPCASFDGSCLQADLAQWEAEVTPLIGKTDIFVFPQGEVLSEQEEKYQLLLDGGFTTVLDPAGFFQPDDI